MSNGGCREGASHLEVLRRLVRLHRSDRMLDGAGRNERVGREIEEQAALVEAQDRTRDGL
jgi:hypothetical protein